MFRAQPPCARSSDSLGVFCDRLGRREVEQRRWRLLTDRVIPNISESYGRGWEGLRRWMAAAQLVQALPDLLVQRSAVEALMPSNRDKTAAWYGAVGVLCYRA